MKISLAAITALFAVALFSLATATPAETETSPCCMMHSKTAFPRNSVKDYFYTSSACKLPSIVFIFNNEMSGCADPNAQWAKDLVTYLASVTTPASSTSTAVPTTRA